MSELTKFEKVKQRYVNKTATSRRVGKHNDSFDDDGSDQSENMTMEGPNESKKGKKEVKQMVSRGVSRGESLASLSAGDEVGQKIEELIEEKSRSIVNVITQNQMSQFYNIYSHPYSAATQIPYTNIPIGMYNSVGTGSNSDFFQGQSPYQ